jgi:hypothetical protein
MWTDIKQYVDGCIICQKSKPRVGPGSDKLHPMPIAGSPWEIMSWDLVGPLPESRTYNAIVTMVDTKTKAIKLKPANITITALGTAVVMRNWVFREEGLPAKVISDRGSHFVSGFMKKLYKLLGVEGNPSTTYHPQTDGQTERTNREVEKYLRMFTNHQQDDWVDWLPLAEFAYNNAVHEATGQTPFFLNKGRHLRTLESDPLPRVETSAEEFLQHIKKATKSAEDSLRKAKEAMKSRWEGSWPRRKDFEPGDLVLVTADHLPSRRPSQKLDQKWRGPFKILRKMGEAAYKIDLPPHWKGHRTFNKGRLKKFETPRFQIQEQLPQRPELELVNG